MAEPMKERFKKGDFIGQKYEVFDVLGEGGFGIVYLVYCHETKDVYALKTFKDEFLTDIKTRDRFKKEAQVWIDLEQHPYLVRAYFVDEIAGRLYIAMEHIASDEPGMNTLSGYLRNRPPDLAQTLKWSIQFCYGMEHAYSKGVKAHRDIKPANIMIDQNKNVKISDFGLAGVLPQSSISGQRTGLVNAGSGANMQTVVGSSIGTPEYMSPEQFDDLSACDERSDIYSFGIVLYQMASGGKLPFFSDNPTYRWTALKHFHRETTVPKVSSPLSSVIERCLAKEPGRRYQSFSAVNVELAGMLRKLTGEFLKLSEKGELDSSEWNNKGVSLMNLKRYEEAIACFDRAIKIDKQNGGAWSNKGNVFGLQLKYSDAMICYDRAIQINPKNSRAWANKGALFVELGQLDHAITSFNCALESQPVTSYLVSQIGGLLHALEPSKAKHICQKIIDLKLKPSGVDGLFNLGLCYFLIDDTDNALKVFLEAELVDGNDSGVWFWLMNIYFKKQNAANTLKYCDKLIEVHKYFDESVKIKSLVLSNTGKMQQAISLLKNVLAKNGNLDLLWITLSGLYERSHDFEEALNAAKKCLQMLNASKSKDSYKIAYVSKVIDGLSQKQANAGIPEIEQAILNLKAAEIDHNKQKPHADAIKRLIRLYVDNADKQKALYYCDMLIKTTNYITDYGNKALVMSFFSDYAGAVVLLADILKEWPHVDDLWYVLSNIHERQKNYPEALKAALQCRDILLGKRNPDRQNLMYVENKIKELQKLLGR